MKRNWGGIIAIVVVALILANASMFVVDQRQAAIVFRLGQIVSVIKQPGLYFKIPLLENVRYFDTRILTLDTAEPQRYLTSEKKNLLVDSFVKWRVVNPRQYYVSVGGDEARAMNRLDQTVNDLMRAEFGKLTINQVVSSQRDEVMDAIRAKAQADASKIGVQVVDVRLQRVELPKEVSESVYRRMEAERKRVANELRSTGAAEAEQIKAEADKQKDITVAEAYGNAQKIKGEGDARAAAIYAAAYDKDPQFYAFYRSMQAYRESLKGKNDVIILSPGSDFLKYMQNPRGTGKR